MKADINNIKHIYFLGIGGIGMSALALYFSRHGVKAEGYDRTSTPLTLSLERQGIAVHYHDDPGAIPTDTDLVIYTPAIPEDLKEYKYLRKKGIRMLKRSEVLGLLSQSKYCLAVAGSHGKTTTSSMIAHLLHASGIGCLAFLGGIAKNYNSNYIEDQEAGFFVVEADEYDRSFLQLTPDIAVVTAIDPDHLDIYGSLDSLMSAFDAFIHQIKPGGLLVMKEGLTLNIQDLDNVIVYTYGFGETADFHPTNIRFQNNKYSFSLSNPLGDARDFCLTIPGYFNVENACAALACCLLAGLDPTLLADFVTSYQGVSRRFDKRFEQGGITYIDDYAHHPRELDACISSVRKMYPGKKITGVFQPHLFSRTKDLADDFAECLASLDKIILLEIYPAREEPLPGINSEFLLGKIKHNDKVLISREDLLTYLAKQDIDVLLTLGAGDIDQFVEPIVSMLKTKTRI